MAIYPCHRQPDVFRHTAAIVAVRPGAVAVSVSHLHPGGGGQVADRGTIDWGTGPVVVTTVEVDPATGQWWHVFDDADLEPQVGTGDEVEIHVDAAHRHRVASLHTVSHVLNALVFDEFAGALVTGAQINGDGTGRMDFDLPQVDNDRIRALEAPVNEVIARGVDVRSVYVDAADADRSGGLVRSMSVAPPPTPDGRLRVIEIEGVDRQACGGTHLANTAESAPIRLTKIENKGRHNRRVRFTFAE